MDEIEMGYYRALGIEPAPEEGAKEQEVADPAQEVETEEPAEDVTEEVPEDDAAEADETEEGANEQEVAEPAEDKPVQSKEQRARQAEGRRRRERAAEEERIRQEERAAIDGKIKAFFEWAGFRDGDAPIETVEQMEAYQQKSAAEQMERDLKAGKLTPEMLRQTVAEEVARQTPEPGQTPEADSEAFRAQVESELAEIRKYDPGVKSVQDLMALDRAEELTAQVTDHGHTFLEAYRYVYADKIAEQRAAAAAQRTRNAARSKDHLQPVGARGKGDVPVPAADKAMYRQMFPDMTDEEIRKDYQRYERTRKK